MKAMVDKKTRTAWGMNFMNRATFQLDLWKRMALMAGNDQLFEGLC